MWPLGGGAGASVGGAGGGSCVTGGGGAGASVVVVGGSVVVVVDSVVVVGGTLLTVVVLVVVAVVVMVATTGCGLSGGDAGAVDPNTPVRTTSAATPPPSEVTRRDHTGVRHHQRASAEGAGSAGTLMRDQYAAAPDVLGRLPRVHSKGR